MITTTQKVVNMRKLTMMRILIRKNWTGYYKILKENKISSRRKIKKMIEMQKKKMTLRI